MTAVCTVVVRWTGSAPTQVLALRDERTDREFDDPGRWWADQPGVVGGRDRTAGGTWCAVGVGAGVAALVLNRPDKRVADAGAPSRGVLPLLAVEHGADWVDHVDVAGMASFLLVLVTPEGLTSWTFDGEHLAREELSAGTSMFTSGFEESGKVERYLPSFEASGPDGWLDVVHRERPADDPAALLVRHPGRDPEGRPFVFATVFGQLFTLEPGRLDLQYSRHPETDVPWRDVRFG